MSAAQKVVVRTSIEDITLTFRKGALHVVGQVSKVSRKLTDPVEVLNELRHFQEVGFIIEGDIDFIRKQIIGVPLHFEGEPPQENSFL